MTTVVNPEETRPMYKTLEGQLTPLDSRTTTHHAERRTQKQVRRLGVEHARTRGLALGIAGVLHRGFFGRMKWLLFGK